MTKQDFLTRQVTMLRLLNIFGGMNGGCDYIDLRKFVDDTEGETITRIMKHMSLLLDAAEAATYVTEEDLPDWAKERAAKLE